MSDNCFAFKILLNVAVEEKTVCFLVYLFCFLTFLPNRLWLKLKSNLHQQILVLSQEVSFSKSKSYMSIVKDMITSLVAVKHNSFFS